MSEDRFNYKVEFEDDNGKACHEVGAMVIGSDSKPMPDSYTIDVRDYSFTMLTDQGGIRVLPGGKITITVQGTVLPYHGEHTMEIYQFREPSDLDTIARNT